MTDNSRQSYRRGKLEAGGGGLAETVRTCVETLLTAVSSGGWRPPAHGGISGGIYDELSKKFFLRIFEY